MMPRTARPMLLSGLLAAAVLTAGCEEAYYRAMEGLGKHKRDLLVEEVEATRDSQVSLKAQFKSALDRFRSVVNFEGGELEAKYNELKRVLAESEAEAENVRNKIANVEQISADLFAEWEMELEQYASDDLRLTSEIQLRDTQKRYAVLLRAMKRADQKMDPALRAFRDQVLFLKHNLNARAVASLSGTVVSLEEYIGRLVEELEAAIDEANAFIDAMGRPVTAEPPPPASPFAARPEPPRPTPPPPEPEVTPVPPGPEAEPAPEPETPTPPEPEPFPWPSF
jgi:hypothetical protein